MHLHASHEIKPLVREKRDLVDVLGANYVDDCLAVRTRKVFDYSHDVEIGAGGELVLDDSLEFAFGVDVDVVFSAKVLKSLDLARYIYVLFVMIGYHGCDISDHLRVGEHAHHHQHVAENNLFWSHRRHVPLPNRRHRLDRPLNSH